MMTLRLNDEVISIHSGTNLEELLQARILMVGEYAVAVNNNFVPRVKHITTVLVEGDVIDIILPMQGG